MRLPIAPDKYDRRSQQQTNTAIEQADTQNIKRGTDIEVGGARLILRSPAGHRFAITVSDAGVVSATAIT